MLKRFIHYYKPHKKMLAMDMLASLLISVIGMVYPIVTNKMLNIYIPEKMYTTIVIAGLIVLVLYIVRMLLRYFVQYYGHLIGVQMQSQMRQDLFAHLEKQPFSFYDNHETGRIMTRITSDLFEVCELAHHGPENLLISSVMILLSFTYLFLIDPILTLIIFACVPVLVVVTLYFRRAMSRAFWGPPGAMPSSASPRPIPTAPGKWKNSEKATDSLWTLPAVLTGPWPSFTLPLLS